MRLRQQSGFSFVRTEGAILPADLLSRIKAGDASLGGLRSEDYHLLAGERLNEAISRSWNRMLGAWASFQTAYANLPPGGPAFGVTREKLLLPLFDELHYGRLNPTKALEVNGKSYPVSHGWRSVPIHLVGYGVKLDTRTPGVAGAARYSPHGMMQELLNRSDDHLWGFVSNGVILRILRDNASLTRQAFVEFNLESIFDGEAYADFALLWLLCHQSRVESDRPDEFWLERWSQTARTEGARALDRLRYGVEEAIRALGRGFIAHPANQTLRERLRKGDLSSQDFYRQLLRLVYRLIFLFAAEDRGLLFPPEASTEARERYRRFYSTSRLRSLSAHRRGTAHTDMYRGLLLIMRKLGEAEGCPELGLPALGSFLWSEEAVPDLETCQIANHDLLAAVRHLASSEESGVRCPIDYRNLGAEELGSVYEALLELNPEISLEGKTFELKVVGGSERKTTGSYYTPSSLIQQLLDTALDPVIDKALLKPNPQEALLGLKVCDPACGSGHFLVAAAHRIARRLAILCTGDDEPSPDAQRHALRDVIRHCIYGVDINPLAAELCKVNLWLETIDPGLPLSFLDHRIICGNSLLGATPRLMAGGIPDEAFDPIEGDDRSFASALKRQNRRERPDNDLQEQGIASGQFSMFDRLHAVGRDLLQNISSDASSLDAIEEDTIDGVVAKQQAFNALVGREAYQHSKIVADAWCAAFVWTKTVDAAPAVTDSVFRRLAKEEKEVVQETISEIRRLAESYRFLHWHLAFPGVFVVPGGHESIESEQTGWSGGFDVVLGNPPWERVKLQEKEWFAGRHDDIANAPTKAARTRLINSLEQEDPALRRSFLNAKRQAEGESQFVRESGRYPLCGRGDVNTYALFSEHALSIVGNAGYIGIIVPAAIASDETLKVFFQHILANHQIVGLTGFENEDFIFPSIANVVRFCLLGLSRQTERTRAPEFAFYLRRVSQINERERFFELTYEDVSLFSPNTLTCPVFRTKTDMALTRMIYMRLPVVGNEATGENPWGVSFLRHFDMANDSRLFLENPTKETLPLYEAKYFWHYNHRFGSYDVEGPGRGGRGLAQMPDQNLADPNYGIMPRYWVKRAEATARLKNWPCSWLVAFRDVVNAKVERTSVFAVLPIAGVGHTAPLLFVSPAYIKLTPCLLANLNSLVFDYCVRQKIGGTHLSYGILRQIPILHPASFTPEDLAFITPRVVELIYTAHDMQPFALDMGFSGPPYRWDERRRRLLAAELDAYIACLYGLTHEELNYILDPSDTHGPEFPGETFRVLKEKEMALFGEYITKKLVLEAHRSIHRSREIGEPHQTLLDPPPASPKAAHPRTGPGRMT